MSNRNLWSSVRVIASTKIRWLAWFSAGVVMLSGNAFAQLPNEVIAFDGAGGSAGRLDVQNAISFTLPRVGQYFTLVLPGILFSLSPGESFSYAQVVLTSPTTTATYTFENLLVTSANSTNSGNTTVQMSYRTESIATTSNLDNTALGTDALYSNTTGTQNTALGFEALLANSNGQNNVALGVGALVRLDSGNDNTAIGSLAGSGVLTGSNDIFIGNQGLPSDNAIIRIGTMGTQTSTYIAGIVGVNLSSDANAKPLVIDSVTGQLGTSSGVGGTTGPAGPAGPAG